MLPTHTGGGKVGNLITVHEAAQVMGVTTGYVRRMARTGLLAGKRMGRDWFIEEAAARSWKRERAPRQPNPKD